MNRETYQALVLPAEANEIGDSPIWRGRVFIEHHIDQRTGRESRILPGIESKRFLASNVHSPATLALDREYGEGILSPWIAGALPSTKRMTH
jgi:hypothetical protein